MTEKDDDKKIDINAEEQSPGEQSPGEQSPEEQSPEELDATEKALRDYIDFICMSGKRPRIRYRKNYVSVNGRRFYYDDDGRTVAPMDGASGIFDRKSYRKVDPTALENAQRTLRGFDRKSARSFTCGSLTAALLVAAVLIGVIGLLIWLLTAVW